jgi:hypothetical protein
MSRFRYALEFLEQRLAPSGPFLAVAAQFVILDDPEPLPPPDLPGSPQSLPPPQVPTPILPG